MHPTLYGVYRHYKGHCCLVTGLAKHSATSKDMVLYQRLDGQGDTWVCPVSQWNEMVEADGKPVPRFSCLARHGPETPTGKNPAESTNIFALPILPLREELVTILAEKRNLRLERIISTGQTSAWYEQEEAEYVILLQGQACLEYADGSTVTMTGGDTLLIEPYQRHRVSYTSTQPPCVWLCLFMAEK